MHRIKAETPHEHTLWHSDAVDNNCHDEETCLVQVNVANNSIDWRYIYNEVV